MTEVVVTILVAYNTQLNMHYSYNLPSYVLYIMFMYNALCMIYLHMYNYILYVLVKAPLRVYYGKY